jgi:hypothetical protein
MHLAREMSEVDVRRVSFDILAEVRLRANSSYWGYVLGGFFLNY